MLLTTLNRPWSSNFVKDLSDIDYSISSRRSSSFDHVNMYEEDDAYFIDVLLPSYTKEEVNIEIQEGYLNISAEKKATEKERKYIVKGWEPKMTLKQRIRIGDTVDVDNIDAKFDSGILKIKLQRKESERTRKIPVY